MSPAYRFPIFCFIKCSFGMVRHLGRSVIYKSLSNIPGWRSKRKLVILESDDWGSIRMPSNDAFDILLKAGIDMASDAGFRYNKFDSLATVADMSSLFEVLLSVKDSTDRPVVITPFSVVANPDFDKIQQSDFAEYIFEPFTETLKKYPGCENSWRLWQEGIDSRLFIPQFHGREHLNVRVWMRALQARHEKALKAFNNKMWGISTGNDPGIKVEFQAAFDFIDPGDLKYHEEVIRSGLGVFEKLFGYRATCFVPPNGPFSSRLESVCTDEGLKLLSLPKLQYEPLSQGKKRIKFHWTGQKSEVGLTYITRNCLFEPGQPGRDWVNSCLFDISNAFKWHKPAIISSHRVNYIGALYIENRENGLKQLRSLLKNIMKQWNDAEFITSAELGGIISSD